MQASILFLAFSAISAYQSIMRLIFGYEFMCVHIDAKNGKRKVFHCTTYADALEWMACACNDDTAKIVSRQGYLIAQRG